MILNKVKSFVSIYIVFLFFQNIDAENTLFKRVDFNVDQFREHKTVKFYRGKNENSKVIIRRANDFKFDIELNEEAYNKALETVLTFKTNWDELKVTLTPKNEVNGWKLTQIIEENRIKSVISVPADSPVGVWKMNILIKDSNSELIEEIPLPNDIVILFNPWSSEDEAYFPNRTELKEYAMGEKGFIYTYNWVKIGFFPWLYGQFINKVFNGVLMVLDRLHLLAKDRGNIVLVTRHLTYLINYGGVYDGVLAGKWEEPYNEYEGRRASNPMSWPGSAPIFKKYFNSGGKTVAYGQCWVYGGVLTTALRALGIAARPITTFVSAHSKDRDLTVDIYYDKKGRRLPGDMVWNFHVWVQAWFSRKRDLGEKYSGWQELDATPQERNDGLYQVGPGSTYSIKESKLNKKYETKFLYEEVNADEVVWFNGHIHSINQFNIGFKILTKKPFYDQFEEITELYKPREGTKEERESYKKAAKSMKINPPSLNITGARSGKKEVIIKMETQGKLTIGSTVNVKIKVKNQLLKTKEITVTITATSMYYSGEDGDVLKTSIETKKIKTTKDIMFEVKTEEYLEKLCHGNTIRIDALAETDSITETGFEMLYFSLQTPELIIESPKSVEVHQAFEISVKMQNPFDFTLTDIKIIVEGIQMIKQEFEIKDIQALTEHTEKLKLESQYAFTETIVVQFQSAKLQMKSSFEIIVEGKQDLYFSEYILNAADDISSRSMKKLKNLNAGKTVNHKTYQSTKLSSSSFKCCNQIKF